jgi:outer membrane protein assembly factor BamB
MVENWPRWRGADGSGIVPEGPLPVKWDGRGNVRWKIAVPGDGASSPVIWQDRIFLTAASPNGKERMVHCFSRGGGKLLWTRSIQHDNPERTSALAGHAAATPATDGRYVVAAFGNAGLVCYDLEGRQIWRRDLGEFDSELGLATSPVIDRRRVFLVCDHDGDRFSSFDSYIAAIDLATGQALWKTERRGLGRSWSTPIVVPGRESMPELVVSAQDHVRAYDLESGQELWQAAATTGWVAPSPVYGHGLIFIVSGKNGPIAAIRPGGRGDVTATHIAWRHEHGGPYVCSPIVYGSCLYLINEQGVLSCYEAKSGALEYQQRLEGKFTASPIAGDGKLYFTNEDGTSFVVQAGSHYALLSSNRLGEYCLASPAAAGGELFLRSEKHLYCIGRQ